MGSITLNVSASTTLNGSGNGTVSLGPAIPGVTWYPATAAVIVNPVSGSVVSQFFLYQGPAGSTNFLGGTYTGDNNSTDVSVTLYTGQILTGVWTGGNPGATATLSLSGTQTVPGNFLWHSATQSPQVTSSLRTP